MVFWMAYFVYCLVYLVFWLAYFCFGWRTCVLFGVFGVLFGVLGVLFGVLGVLFGIGMFFLHL